MNHPRLILALLLAAVVAAGPDRAYAGTGSNHGEDNNVVHVDAGRRQLSGVETERLSPAIHRTTVKAYGQVEDIGNLIGLMTGFQTAATAAKKAAYQLEVSRNVYRRTRALFNSSRYVSLQKLQDAEAAYNSDLADSESAFEKMSSVRSLLMQHWGGVIAGWVENNSPAARDLEGGSLSLVLITVPAGARAERAPERATLSGPSGGRLTARLVSASPVSNQDIQGASYFYILRHTSTLAVGMSVVARLPRGEPMNGVIVPSSSVVWRNGKAWAYVETGKDRFTRRQIDTSEPAVSGWFVTGGIKPGQKVVIHGAQLLLSQEFRSLVQGGDD